MTKKQWRKIKHFNVKEKWGDPYKMDFKLVWLLDELREHLDEPIIIHCGYELEGHAKNSFHKTGKAVDFHVEGIDLYAAWGEIDKLWWFGGAGFYPHWNSPGFHLDLGLYRRWYRNKQGSYFKIIDGVFEEEL